MKNSFSNNPYGRNESHSYGTYLIILITLLLSIFFYWGVCRAEYSNEEIANAIYKAEGGDKTSHPYGILAHYKHTTPRQACLNTIAHAKKDWNGQGDFIEFLGARYCPVGAKNDPAGLNKNWVKNVKYFLARGKK